MSRSDKNTKALVGASTYVTMAFEALSSPEFNHIPKSEKEAWAMAGVIYCDIARLTVALDECEAGIARLLSMADLVAKLYEAKEWYFNSGAINLRKIAKGKQCDAAFVDKRLKELKSQFPIAIADDFKPYRNKVAYHYDSETTLEYLSQFGREENEKFGSVLMTFVRFAAESAELTRLVIQSPAREKF